MINDEYQEQQVVKREVVYARPSLFRRVMANLVDLLIFAFVTSGFEHCVANMYYITAGLLCKINPDYLSIFVIAE